MRWLRRLLLIVLVLVLVLAGSLTGLGLYTFRRMLPQTSGTLSLAGLKGDVTIYRDAQGIAHIYASNVDDLFFAQGVVHAQDRWWQMEFQRHVGLGRIGELTGRNEEIIKLDTFIRTVGWNRLAQADLDAAPPESLRVLNAYSAGINAYLAGKSGGDLAVEYSLLGVTGVSIPIEPWQPLHSAAWAKVLTWQLSNNLDLEVTVGQLINRLGTDVQERILADFVPTYPASHPSILDAADTARISDSPNQPNPKAAMPSVPMAAAIQTTLAGGLSLDTLAQMFPHGASNSWVVNGSRTASGKPLLANDPHLGIQMPSLFYQMGLHCAPVSDECPYDVVGFSLPAAPGILIGHNARIAWGLTTAQNDTQDVYIIKVDPSDDTRYEVDGQMQPMQVITETIKFGDNEPSLDVRVRQTRFGPIITDSPNYADHSKSPLALRWAAADGPIDTIGAILGVNRANDWDDFRAALSKWVSPPQNFVYADVDGNIGYQLPGLSPIRAAGTNGLVPLDGSTTRYDWLGYVPYDMMPRIFNPERGYIATANNQITPKEFNGTLAGLLSSQYGAESFYFDDYDADFGYRAVRVVEMLNETDKHSVASFQAMQYDVQNNFAAAFLPKVLKLDFGPDIEHSQLDWLGSWDYNAQADNAQQALFEVFWTKLVNNIWADEVGSEVNGGSRYMWATTRLLDQPDSPWWDNIDTKDTKETREDVVRASMKEALTDVKARLGAEDLWAWGKLHTASFVNNPLGLSGIGPIEQIVNAGPLGMGGSITTVQRMGYNANATDPYEVTSISALRMIVDLSDPNKSIGLHPTGQSGHPVSGHYRDLIEGWRTGVYLPLAGDRAEIEKSAVETLTLKGK